MIKLVFSSSYCIERRMCEVFRGVYEECEKFPAASTIALLQLGFENSNVYIIYLHVRREHRILRSKWLTSNVIVDCLKLSYNLVFLSFQEQRRHQVSSNYSIMTITPRIGSGLRLQYPILIKLIQFDHSLSSYLYSTYYLIVLIHSVQFFLSCSVCPILWILCSIWSRICGFAAFSSLFLL